MKKLLGLTLLCLSSAVYAKQPAFLAWDINKTVEKWNSYASSFAPNFQVSGCEPSKQPKNNHLGYFCFIPDAPSAFLIIDTVGGKTSDLWLSFNSHTSLEKPADVLRIPALLTKMSRDVDYGNHLDFVRKIIKIIVKTKGSECAIDEASGAKFCGSMNQDYQFDYTIEVAK